MVNQMASSFGLNSYADQYGCERPQKSSVRLGKKLSNWELASKNTNCCKYPKTSSLIYGLHRVEIYNGDRLLDPFQLEVCLIPKNLGELIMHNCNSASVCVCWALKKALKMSFQKSNLWLIFNMVMHNAQAALNLSLLHFWVLDFATYDVLL